MLKYVVEFLGTFVFLAVIMNTAFGAAGKTGLAGFPIGLALAAVIFFGGNISGGHFNPAVSTMMMLGNKMSSSDYLPYVAAQVLGGVAALYFYKSQVNN
tara:strand:+ start:3075 stop:3371 length:297 start_codon:yes stop_codon:yes gene_type:complete